MQVVNVKARNVVKGDVVKLTPEMGVKSLAQESKSPYRKVIKRYAHMERKHGNDVCNVYMIVRDYGNGLAMIKLPEDKRVVIKRPKYNFTK